MPLRLLIDLDALTKLAHWDLLGMVLNAGQCQWSDCATVESARPRALKAALGPDGKLFRDSEAARRVIPVLTKMQSLPAIDPEALALFQDQSGIDAGEAVLLACLLRQPHAVLITGDKRCVRALAAMSDSVRSQIEGRVLVLEQLILKAIDLHGVVELRRRVVSHLTLDKAVHACMGSRCDAPEDSVRQGLASYLREMHSLCSPSLLMGFSASPS